MFLLLGWLFDRDPFNDVMILKKKGKIEFVSGRMQLFLFFLSQDGCRKLKRESERVREREKG